MIGHFRAGIGLLLATLSMAVQANAPIGKPMPSMARPNSFQALTSSAPDVFRCKTGAEWDAQTCTTALPSPFDASAYDNGIGGIFSLDGVVNQYILRFTAPSNGTVYDIKFTKGTGTTTCSNGYLLNEETEATCYQGAAGYLIYVKRRSGQWKIELLADTVVKWTAYSNVKPAELKKLSGDGASAPINEFVRIRPTFTLKNFDGTDVDVAESSDGNNPEIVTFTVTGPSRATGMWAESPDYPWHKTSDEVTVKLGDKAGTYTVTGSMAGATMSSPFTFSAVPQQEGPDQTANEEGVGDGCCTVLDPIAIGIGNSFQQATDYAQTGLSFLEFTRSYNSMGSKGRLTHNYWNTTFDRFLVLPTQSGDPVKVRRADGKTINFFLSNGVYQPRVYFKGSLVKTGTTWRYTDTDQSVELFDAAGKLTSITDLSGRSLTLTYNSTTGTLTKVTANTGESLSFTYNSYNQMLTMTDNASRVWTYAYNAYANLVSVKRPDGTLTNYGYHDPANAYFLTALSNHYLSPTELPQENAEVTWTYDSLGRVTSNYTVEGGQNKKGGTISYLPDGSRVVTDLLSRATTYRAHTLNGRGFVDEVDGPSYASSGVADSKSEYNASMDVIASTSFGRRTEFGNYDAKGQYGYMIEAAGTPNARRTDFTYDSRFIGKPTSITSPSVYPGRSRIRSLTYDGLGNLTSETTSGFSPDGSAVIRSTTYQYAGPFGQVSQIDGPRTDAADITRFDYDATTKRLVRVTDADGIVLRNNLKYSPSGQLVGEDRPNGLKLAYTYRAGTNLLEKLVETQGTSTRTTTWTYTQRQTVDVITFSDGVNPDLAVKFYYNDDSGVLTGVGNPGTNYSLNGFDTPATKVFLRDLAGNVAHEQTTGALEWLDRTFDAYNHVDKLISAVGTTDYDYRPDGTLAQVTDGNLHATTFEHDDFKRMTRQVQPGLIVTSYAFDVQDHLIQVTDGNQAVTRYKFDDLGNQVQLQSPDTGTSLFVYDGAGNLVQSTDAKGQVTTRSYSAGNRLLSVDRAGASEDETYAYDNCANGVGKLCSVTSGNGEYVAYEYDGFGRPSLVVTPAGGLAYSYDAKDNVTAITYPSGRRVSYAHNSASQVTQAALLDGVRTTILAGKIKNLPMGPSEAWTYGNGLSEVRQFNAAYLPVSQGVAGKFQISYPQYDANGNLLQRVVGGQVENYSYDALDRLHTASGGFGLRTYDYDAVGNRIKLTADGVVTNMAYQAQSNRIASDTSGPYSLDPNGNVFSKPNASGGTFQFSYSQRNQLETVALGSAPVGSTAAYVHNALGQRTLKSLNGTERRFVYGLDGKLLAETLADGSVVEEYVYLNGQPLALLGSQYHPAAPPVVDAIVEDTNGLVAGTWTTKKLSGAYGGQYRQLTIADPYTDYFTWNWLPPVPGIYDMWVWWDRKPTDGTSTAYDVYEPGALTRVTLAHTQQTLGAWSYLGRFHLETSYRPLTLWEAQAQPVFGSPSGTVLAADAARFKLVELDDGQESDYRYVLTDQLGTPQAVSDKSGTVIWKATYDPFGAAVVNADPDGNAKLFTLNLRFPGQYFDGETGQHYNYFRDYDAGIGRYLQSDPTGLAGGTNTYGYVRGNPLNSIDPLGLRDVVVAVWDSRPLQGEVGHVYLGEMNGQVITSQFPYPHASHGDNMTYGWDATLKAEHRQPDSVFRVHVTDDAAFDKMARGMRDRPDWDWYPDKDSETNCVYAAAHALDAGGVHSMLVSPLLPGDLETALVWLAYKQRQGGGQITVTPIKGVPW